MLDWILPTAIAGGSLISGILGYFSNKSAQERAEALQDRAFREWLDINVPDPEKQKLALQEFVVAGTLTPEMESAIKQDPSAFEKVTQDAKLKSSRLRSLKSLEDLGTGAETYEDKAAQERALIESAAQARGAQKAIVSNLAQRGQLGTGRELSARMGQAQADADRSAKSAMDIEGNRRIRALKAIESAGSLAGDISDDDYRLQSDKARAADAIANFNTRNMQDVQQRNVGARNRASQYNLDTAQEIANKNTALRNYEQEHNKNLLQQQFENRTKLAAGRTGQYNQGANAAIAAGKNSQEFWGTLGGSIPKALVASKAYFDDEEDEE